MSLQEIKAEMLKALSTGAAYANVYLGGVECIVPSKYSPEWINKATDSDIKRVVVR
jgi:hypothetical protein